MALKIKTAPAIEPVTVTEVRTHLGLPTSPNYAVGIATQTATLPITGVFTLSIAGTGSVAAAAGTAVGTGWGSATSALSLTLNITATGTITLTVTGSVTAISLTVAQSDDSFISALITAAREQAENITNRVLITQTWELYLDDFPNVIDIPKSPLQVVNSITYLDENGDEQTLGDDLYRVDIATEPARIVPAYGEVWPTTRGDISGIVVDFDAGYGDTAADIPQSIKQWMLLAIGSMYENRESIAIGGQVSDLRGFADYLLNPYRVF